MLVKGAPGTLFNAISITLLELLSDADWDIALQ